jgi:(p)ppGpp synthase/HD superfamily hydrolase
MNIVNVAKELATKSHAGQFRRDGKTPYITHPATVASRMQSEVEQAVAWLHDALTEEGGTLTTEELINSGLPFFDVVLNVCTLTHYKSEPYMKYIEHVAQYPIARKVKIQDILSNMADKPSDRQKEKYGPALELLRKADKQ